MELSLLNHRDIMQADGFWQYERYFGCATLRHTMHGPASKGLHKHDLIPTRFIIFPGNVQITSE